MCQQRALDAWGHAPHPSSKGSLCARYQSMPHHAHIECTHHHHATASDANELRRARRRMMAPVLQAEANLQYLDARRQRLEEEADLLGEELGQYEGPYASGSYVPTRF